MNAPWRWRAERRGNSATAAEPGSRDRRFGADRSCRARTAFGIDCLFVTRGIHSEEFAGIDQLDPASMKELFGHPPLALTRELKW